MSFKKHKILIPFLTLVLIFSCFKKSNGLKQSHIKPLFNRFLTRHVNYHEFTFEISKRTVSNYIRYLDPGKHYFYKADIDKYLNNQKPLYESMLSNNFGFVYEIFALYKKRAQENMALFNQLLAFEYDFNKDETIVVDSDKLEYVTDKTQMTERWRKNIKLQLLNYVSVVKDIKYAKEKLKKKYVLVEKRVQEMNDERIISLFVNAFSTALDPHSNYLSQEDHEDFMISTKLKLEGIGALLRAEDGFVKVESLVPGGAASKLPENIRLKPNDKIVAVGQGTDEPVDTIDMDLRDVVKMIRGKKATEVRLSIIRDSDESGKQVRMVIPIIREEIKLEDRAAKSEVFTQTRNKKNFKIGYIYLPSFYRDFDAINSNDPNAKSSSLDVIRHINALNAKGIQGMVVDLRGNPGGALDEAVKLAGLFIDQGPIVQIKYSNNYIEPLNDDTAGVAYKGPLVVLIDKFSASASEIFAGAIKDYKRGLIVGSSNTFGKGTVQSYEVLPSQGGAIKITTAIFYQPGGSSNQLNGVSPDITVPGYASIWDIGENHLKYPLQWMNIKSAYFAPYNEFVSQAIIKAIGRNSSGRIRADANFKKMIEKIETYKEKYAKKTISLKEEAIIEKHKDKEMEKKAGSENREKIIDIENDLFLKEAFEITTDYIQMVK